MSRADELYKATCRKILEEGFSDENLEVRPHWEDGTLPTPSKPLVW